MDRKWLGRVIKDLARFGQMGMYVVVPPIIMGLIGIWLQKKFNLGAWVILVSIILGLLSAFTSVAKICLGVLAKNTKEEPKNKVISYRKHE